MGVFFNLSLKNPLEQKVARPGLRWFRRRSARSGRHPYFRSVVLDTSAPASSVFLLFLFLSILFVLSGFIRRWMPRDGSHSDAVRLFITLSMAASQAISPSYEQVVPPWPPFAANVRF